MIHHFNEQNRRNLGIVWFIVGMVFLFSGLTGGIIFFILGMVWLATSSGQGLELFRDKPDYMVNVLRKATIFLLFSALIILLIDTIP